MNLDIKKRIDAISHPESIKLFFDLINEFIKDNSISETDERFVLNVRNDYRKRFSVNLNSRLILYIKDGYEFGFMIDQEDWANFENIPITKKESFEKYEPAAFLVTFSFDEVVENRDLITKYWLKSCKEYLPSQQRSQYRKHHMPELFNIATKSELLDKYLMDPIESYSKFQQIIIDFKEYIKSEDSKLNNFEIQKIYQKYVWISDAERIIGQSSFCHYELITRDKYPEKIWIELHFDKRLKKEMKKNLNYLLDDDLFWNSEHGEELSLALKKNMDFNDAELFPKLESGITKIEEKFGQIVRDFYSKEKSIEEEKIKSTMQNKPLNQILYGPPGTGKTFNTINKAISIANPEFNLNEHREILKKEYDRLVEAEQIVFTTFHQSMSYEDFIEGIKPVMTEDEGEVNYEIQDGIFKEICKTASQVNEITVVDNFEDSWGKLIEVVKENIADDKLVKIGSWEYGLSTKESLKYSSLNSPSQYTFTITKQNILDTYQNKQARPSGAFQKDMEDVVNYMKANLQLSDYRENNDKKQNASKERNYVLIIDEINRGNVSQIFGELITLIEESKRLGNSEELQVTLPYSKKKFGVPSNLYIIGTMNTADRSVEALDTALRRRFSFVEMMPDSSIVEEGDFTDHQRVAIMKKINQRIELLLDRNYTLGHSYFIKNDFKTSFKNEIIPLLQEYFYNDCGKIGLILGRGFVREKEISKVNHQTIFADFDTRNEIEVIKSYELIPFEEIDFENALDLLLA